MGAHGYVRTNGLFFTIGLGCMFQNNAEHVCAKHVQAGIPFGSGRASFFANVRDIPWPHTLNPQGLSLLCFTWTYCTSVATATPVLTP